MHLSAVPAERRLQRAVLVLLGVVVLLLLATLVVLGSSFAAVGSAPELQAEREAWVDGHGLDVVRAVGLVLAPLATLLLPVTAVWDRLELGRVDGLKRQYLLAIVLGGLLGAWWGRWLSVAVIVLGVVVVAAVRRASQPGHERIEGGTLGR